MALRPFPRWGILLIDLALCLIAIAGAYQLRFNFRVPAVEVELLLPVLPLVLAVRAISFWLAGIPRGMVRHTGTDDARRIFLTVLAGSALFALLNPLRFWLVDGRYFLPFSIIIIDAMGTLILLIASRIAVKLLWLRSRGAGKDRVRVLVHGAGEAGLITKRTLEREGSARYQVVGFTDDDPRKAGMRIEGAAVYHSAKLAALLAKGEVDQVIIAIMRPDPEKRRALVDTCLAAGVQVLSIPPVSDWINGQLSAGQLREVRIEDLLGRPVIELDDAAVRAHFSGRTVVVTGAAGSIGSELVRQLVALDTRHLVLMDIAESPLYDLEMELRGRGMGDGFSVVVGDVRDPARVEEVFARHKPQVVFHAAAYKHVPLMEAQPAEAVRTNVFGTRMVSDAACRHGVERFVLISTDKAVNPTSVMGASKRAAEIHVQGLSCGTVFVTTRFGNVLGSNGSVIPLFRRQIEAGGPVTVTHPEVTRYFMTIPEACRLVLEAAAMGKGGEIYVFDMGAPVRIRDLAEKMIRLSGLEPGRDIAITYTGLRPGEKLYEELLASAENTMPTHHPRILIGKQPQRDAAAERHALDRLMAAMDEPGAPSVVPILKELVPEYGAEAMDPANFAARTTPKERTP